MSETIPPEVYRRLKELREQRKTASVELNLKDGDIVSYTVTEHSRVNRNVDVRP